MTTIRGLTMYGPAGFWIFVTGSVAAFIMLNLVSMLYDSEDPLPRFDELATWLAILTSWISAIALAVIATPLIFIALRNGARKMWKEIINYSFFRE